jgi:hypothetical protein
MDRDDVLDLLAIIASTDRRTVGEGELVTWTELIGDLPKDDCLASIMAHRREQPGVWLEPGHIVQRVKAIARDRYERADPNERESAWGDLGGVAPSRQLTFGGGYVDAQGQRRDRYGYLDKSEPGIEYPQEWSSGQRLAAYWERVRTGFSNAPSVGPSPDEHPPGDPCADRECDKPSTFGPFCARHYVQAKCAPFGIEIPL